MALIPVIAFHIQQICLYHFGVTANNGFVPGDLVDAIFGVGHLGVALFFIISGFVLALPFAKQHLDKGPRVSLPAYYLRRVTRLEPPYVIHLVFLFVLCWLFLRKLPSHPGMYHNDAWGSYALQHLTPSLFYSYGFVYGKFPYPNVVLWSLEAEVQFYILAPFLAWVFLVAQPRWRRMLLIGLIVITSTSPFVIPLEWRQRVLLLGKLQFFLAGFFLADLYLSGFFNAPARKTGINLWDAVFLLAGITIVLTGNNAPWAFPRPWILMSSFVAAFKGNLCAKALTNPWITTIGGMCYTIYMYHWFMISGIIRLTIGLETHIVWLDLLVQFLLMTPIIILVCSLLFLLFERPFMRRDWFNKVLEVVGVRSKQKPAG